MRGAPWWDNPDIVTYIIDCYEGVENGKRQFIWQEPGGDVLVGNCRAFTEHLAQKFALGISDRGWMGVHAALRDLGERVLSPTRDGTQVGKRFKNQEPHSRVLQHGGIDRGASPVLQSGTEGDDEGQGH